MQKMMRIYKNETVDLYVYPQPKNKFHPITVGMQGFSQCRENFRIKVDNRSESVLGYVKSGQGIAVTEKGKIVLSPDDVFILRKNERHDYYTKDESGWEFYWYNIDGDFFLEMLSSYYLYETDIFCNTGLHDAFYDSYKYISQSDDSLEEKQINQVLSVYEILMRLADIKNGRDKSIDLKTVVVKNYIDNNIYQKLTLSQIQKQTGIPVHIMNEAFKRDLKVSPYNYILGRKIDTAKSLLKTSHLTVKEISYMLAFADQYYFSNIFKKKTGITPTDYRNKYS